MNSVSLLISSLRFDIQLCTVRRWNWRQKLEFIFKKYYVLVKHAIKPFTLGNDFVYLSGRRFFYASSYGLTRYQSIICNWDALMRAHIPTIKTAVDVGANIGSFSRLIRINYPDCDIFAIEPIEELCAVIKKNFANDKGVHVYSTALSEQEGTARMMYKEMHNEFGFIDAHGNIPITTQTLDGFVKKNSISAIDLLKIDVESLEESVLKGATEALAITHYLIIECTIINNNHYTISSLLSRLYAPSFNFQIVGLVNYKDMGKTLFCIDLMMKNTMIV